MKKSIIMVMIAMTLVLTLTGCSKKQKAGLYIGKSMEMTWQELLDEGIITVTDGEMASGFYENAEDGIGNAYESELCGKLVIDDCVTSIAYSGLRYCTGLNEVVLPKNLTAIDRYAFQNSSIQELNIPKTMESFGNFCVESCIELRQINVDEKNPTYASIDGVLFTKDKTTLIQFPTGSDIDEYTIPEGVTNLNSGAFSCCMDLDLVNIPSSVREIGNSVFWGCENLLTIHYEGTEEEWNEITKGTEWMEHTHAQVTFE